MWSDDAGLMNAEFVLNTGSGFWRRDFKPVLHNFLYVARGVTSTLSRGLKKLIFDLLLPT